MSNVLKIDISTGEQEVIPLSIEEIEAIAISEQERLANLPPNWGAFYGRFLVADLKPIFDDVNEAAKNSTAVLLAYFNLVEAFKICEEQALKDCLDKLIAAGYVISDEHKLLWNNAIAQENFSNLVGLP